MRNKMGKQKGNTSTREVIDEPRKDAPATSRLQRIGKSVLWLGTFWIGAYGYFFQIYDSSKNRIENRASIVISQNMIGRAAATQISVQMKEPMWYFPFIAFWKERNEDVVLQMRAFLEGKKKELSGKNLSGSILDSGDFSEADLSQAKLEKATFIGADMHKADLSFTNLQTTNFEGANLEEVNFHKSKVDWHALSKENFRGSVFFEDTIKDVKFDSTNLDLCHFKQCTFVNVIFENTSLEQTNFIGSKFENTIFKNCNLANANIRQVKIDRTDFTNSNLNGAYRDSIDSEIPGWTLSDEFRLQRK